MTDLSSLPDEPTQADLIGIIERQHALIRKYEDVLKDIIDFETGYQRTGHVWAIALNALLLEGE
jgi:hypothetical protein